MNAMKEMKGSNEKKNDAPKEELFNTTSYEELLKLNNEIFIVDLFTGYDRAYLMPIIRLVCENNFVSKL